MNQIISAVEYAPPQNNHQAGSVIQYIKFK